MLGLTNVSVKSGQAHGIGRSTWYFGSQTDAPPEIAPVIETVGGSEDGLPVCVPEVGIEVSKQSRARRRLRRLGQGFACIGCYVRGAASVAKSGRRFNLANSPFQRIKR